MTDPALLEGFAKAATASIADAPDRLVGRRCSMDHAIRPRINEPGPCGPAVTIQEMPTGDFPPPPLAPDAIDESATGSVIRIAISDGAPDVACRGGLMTAGAVARGDSGAVLDGAVRDIDGVCVVPRRNAADVLKLAQEIDARAAEQAEPILAAKTPREGLAPYGRS